jgi:succinate dehydrogenase/fumarate reductase flavoprotein subunit
MTRFIPDELVETDVLIVGAGLAGCSAAIQAKTLENQVTLVDKAKVAMGGQSVFAAGIFAIFFPHQDDLETWMRETIELGEYLNDQDWVKLLWERNIACAMELDSWGTSLGYNIFEKERGGEFVRRRSRGHLKTFHSVVNALPMMETLAAKCLERGVQTISRVMVTHLIREDDGRILGAVGIDPQSGKTYLFKGKAVILSASGATFRSVIIGHKNHSGDLQVAAYRIGCTLTGMENSSSNTTSRDYDIHGLNLFVGIGGKFVNRLGEEFMWDYNPTLGNRARQTELPIAFCQEIAGGRGPIYLDMSMATEEDQTLCRKILPETFSTFDAAGINPFKQKVEWIPGFYGTQTSGGGIAINLQCETNIPGLYAAGDITNEPPHGTYSFGGVNLTFCQVSGYIAGENAAKFSKEMGSPGWSGQKMKAEVGRIIDEILAPGLKTKGNDPNEVILHIQSTIIPMEVSYLRTEASLNKALERILSIQEEEVPKLWAKDPHYLMKAWEAKNLAQVAELILRSALFRKESRGWHFRKDYPYTDNKNWLKWVRIRQERNRPYIWTDDVPTPYIKPPQGIMIPPGVKHK